jgi:aspartate/tyrosine/aromatic aminotransferase
LEKGSFGFVEKIMQDPELHEMWENEQEKDMSVISILCEGEEFQSVRK